LAVILNYKVWCTCTGVHCLVELVLLRVDNDGGVHKVVGPVGAASKMSEKNNFKDV
jgi:hypothetical protein